MAAEPPTQKRAREAEAAGALWGTNMPIWMPPEILGVVFNFLPLAATRVGVLVCMGWYLALRKYLAAKCALGSVFEYFALCGSLHGGFWALGVMMHATAPPWMLKGAIRFGHLEHVKIAIARGANVGPQALTEAARSGHWGTYKYLNMVINLASMVQSLRARAQNGQSYSLERAKIAVAAVEGGNEKIIFTLLNDVSDVDSLISIVAAFKAALQQDKLLLARTLAQSLHQPRETRAISMACLQTYRPYFDGNISPGASLFEIEHLTEMWMREHTSECKQCLARQGYVPPS